MLDPASVVIGLEVWKSLPMAASAGVCTLELKPTIPDIETTVIVYIPTSSLVLSCGNGLQSYILVMVTSSADSLLLQAWCLFDRFHFELPVCDSQYLPYLLPVGSP